MPRLTHRVGSCKNGPCPNVHDYEDGRAAVQGELLTDPEALAQLDQMPPDERVVLVPPALLLEYADAIRKDMERTL